jgi:hypothetical protein
LWVLQRGLERYAAQSGAERQAVRELLEKCDGAFLIDIELARKLTRVGSRVSASDQIRSIATQKEKQGGGTSGAITSPDRRIDGSTDRRIVSDAAVAGPDAVLPSPAGESVDHKISGYAVLEAGLAERPSGRCGAFCIHAGRMARGRWLRICFNRSRG